MTRLMTESPFPLLAGVFVMSKISVRKETGTLLFDFNYHGKRCREQTTLRDTKANRRKMEKVLERIEQEIVAGTFDYATFFPGSNRAAEFGSRSAILPTPVRLSAAVAVPDQPVIEQCATPTFGEFTAIWLSENTAVWRRNTIKSAMVHINDYLLPRFADMPMNTIKKADCLGFRADIAKPGGSMTQRTLSAKTVNETMQVLGA
ncbi:MAG: integrase, partial [Paracoccaceae bacterium]